jgi:ubiquinone/menaquinone biosynthesis methyltransferase
MSRNFVDEIFSSVSTRYDKMNDIMSGGLHRLWKRCFIKSIGIIPESTLIDVASGTGDIAIKILKKYETTKVFLCDCNFEMLQIAKERLINNNFLDTNIVCAEAENLPFDDNSFDYYTISFGIRNVSDIKKALQEVYRVLKPGGKFSCLEFSNVENKYISRLYDIYSYNFIPFVGEKVTGNRSAYEYLVESIRQFPHADEFSEMITSSGFVQVQYEKLTFGVVAIHSGVKY